MEKITLTVPASREVSGRALAGVVGSGDMGGVVQSPANRQQPARR